jgi:hypothetical protein
MVIVIQIEFINGDEKLLIYLSNGISTYCSIFSNSTFKCQTIISFFKIHFGNKNKILWKFDNISKQFSWQVLWTLNL